MSENDRDRLEFILTIIEDIEFALTEFNGIVNSLNHRVIKHSILMCLMQIGENLNKLNDEILKKELSARGAYATRNFIAHNYEGVDLGVIEDILRDDLPNLKIKILELLK